MNRGLSLYCPAAIQGSARIQSGLDIRRGRENPLLGLWGLKLHDCEQQPSPGMIRCQEAVTTVMWQSLSTRPSPPRQHSWMLGLRALPGVTGSWNTSVQATIQSLTPRAMRLCKKPLFFLRQANRQVVVLEQLILIQPQRINYTLEVIFTQQSKGLVHCLLSMLLLRSQMLLWF